MSKNRAVDHEDKRELIENSGRKKDGWKKVAFLIFVGAAIALVWKAYNEKNTRKATAIVSENKMTRESLSSDVMTIPLSEITRKAKFFQAKVGGTPVRFFVMRSSDGVIRSALDSCDTCASKLKGYRQQGDFMVCNNCDQRFPSTKINVLRGGCNPVPLNNSVDGDVLNIKVADIQLGARYFNFRR